jgi:hypothetical protein
MPIKGWTCGGCKRRVDLNHYQTSECGTTYCHPDYAAAVIADRSSQDDRSGVRVTSGLGCPRSYAIMDDADLYPDPLSFNSMLTGSAWHAVMESGAENQNATIDSGVRMFGAEVEVSGMVEGIAISGKIDRVRELPAGIVLEDHKHGNDFVRKYSTAPKPEHIVQVSIYGELFEQQFGVRPVAGMIWQHYTSSPPFTPHKFDLWPLAQCLAHHPYSSDYTVLDLYKQGAERFAGKVWAELPLVGQTIKFGAKTGCDYCAVYAECRTAEVGSPF